MRTSDWIACPNFVKILSMSKFGLFYYICLFRIQNILLEICMNMSSLTVTLYGGPKLVISVITVIIVISIHLHLRWIDHKVNHNVNRGQEDRSRERMYIQVNDMHRSNVHWQQSARKSKIKWRTDNSVMQWHGGVSCENKWGDDWNYHLRSGELTK